MVCCYALHFPARIHSLVLVDPWGLQDATEEEEGRIPLPLRLLVSALPSPLSPIRWLDRLGGLGKSAFCRAKNAEHTRWVRSVQTAAATETDLPHRQGIQTDGAHRSTAAALDAHAVHAPCHEPSRHWRWCVDVVRSLAQGKVPCNDMTDYLYCLATVPDCGGDHAFKVEEMMPRVCESLPLHSSISDEISAGSPATVLKAACLTISLQALCRKGFFHFAARPKAAYLLKALQAPGGCLAHVTVDLVYGQDTWIDIEVGREMAASFGDHRSTLAIIPDAGIIPASSDALARTTGTCRKLDAEPERLARHQEPCACVLVVRDDGRQPLKQPREAWTVVNSCGSHDGLPWILFPFLQGITSISISLRPSIPISCRCCRDARQSTLPLLQSQERTENREGAREEVEWTAMAME